MSSAQQIECLMCRRSSEMPAKSCELNRWMQHHLTEIICFRGGVYENRKTVWSFFGTEDRDLAPLEGGRVVACDWPCFRQGPWLDPFLVIAARRDRSGSSPALGANPYAGRAGGDLARPCIRFVDS